MIRIRRCAFYVVSIMNNEPSLSILFMKRVSRPSRSFDLPYTFLHGGRTATYARSMSFKAALIL